MITILCKVLQCCPAIYICAALFLVFFIACRITCQDQINLKAAIIFCLILSGMGSYIIHKKTKDKWPKMYQALCAQETPQTKYLYDSDYSNDNFIKGSLKDQQLKILDQILMKEKKESGLRLSEPELNKISENNNEINGAYSRWRKCKDMMRSSHHIIYPDERDLYKKKQL